MTEPRSSINTKAARRFNDLVEAIPLVKRLFQEVRCDPLSPWYLEDMFFGQRSVIVLLYGSLRRAYARLRIGFLVLNSWWSRPLEPEIVTNGSNLISNSLGGVSKPVLWMASVGIAGAVGSDIANSNSSIASSKQLAIWIYIAIVVAALVAAYHWWRLLDRLRRVLGTWVAECRKKENADRKTDDIALFGYSFGDNFRRGFNVRSVKFLSILTFSAFIYINYRLGHR